MSQPVLCLKCGRVLCDCPRDVSPRTKLALTLLASVLALLTPWLLLMTMDLWEARAEHRLWAECSTRLRRAGIEPRASLATGDLDRVCGALFRAAPQHQAVGVRCTTLAVEIVCFHAPVDPYAGWMVDSCTEAAERSCLTVFPMTAWN